MNPNDITTLEAYLTRATVFDDLTAPLAELPHEEVEAAQREVIETLQLVIERQMPQAAMPHTVVYHVEVPYMHGFSDRFETNDGRVAILPSRIIKDRNRRISAIFIRVDASSKELAKARAFTALTTVCALFTLANAQRYEPATLTWPRTRPPKQLVPDLQAFPADRFYPRRQKWPALELMVAVVPARCEWVWTAYNRLESAEQKTFLSALFAYYVANTRKSDLSTLSAVALAAALSALASPYRQKCEGNLTCSLCGTLGFKHDLAGEVPAITAMISDVCGLSAAQRVELQAVLYRVYRKQRSAYVHGAQLRHEEYGQGSRLPAHLPTNDAPVQELFEYTQDLESLHRITRRTLLSWLAQKAGQHLDAEMFAVNPDRITARLLHSINITFPLAAMVGFATARQAPEA